MYQAYAQELLNQKESSHSDSGDSSMADASQHPLYVATRRLVEALNQLETNLEKMAAKSPQQDPKQKQQMLVFERENETLRRERDNLDTAISQLQFQYNDLHQVASAIYGKLDDSVKRLTQLIDN